MWRKRSRRTRAPDVSEEVVFAFDPPAPDVPADTTWVTAKLPS